MVMFVLSGPLTADGTSHRRAAVRFTETASLGPGTVMWLEDRSKRGK